LLIDNLLNAADKFPALLPLKAHGTGATVASLVRINTSVALIPVTMVLLALLSLSIRPSELHLADLRQRLKAIRYALGFASAILVASVLLSKALLEWPLKLILESQALALRPLADALTLELGAAGTIALFAAFAPAVAAWRLDVERYRAAHPRPGEAAKAAPADHEPDHEPKPKHKPKNADDGLVFAPWSAMTGVIAVLAPVLASPFVDALRSILGAIPMR
jgi:hypothetical protein